MQEKLDNKDHASDDQDFYHHLSEAHLQHQTVRKEKKGRPVVTCRAGTSVTADSAEEEERDRAHSQKTSFKHNTTSPDLEHSGKEKERPRPRNSWKRDMESEQGPTGS